MSHCTHDPNLYLNLTSLACRLLLRGWYFPSWQRLEMLTCRYQRERWPEQQDDGEFKTTVCMWWVRHLKCVFSTELHKHQQGDIYTLCYYILLHHSHKWLILPRCLNKAFLIIQPTRSSVSWSLHTSHITAGSTLVHTEMSGDVLPPRPPPAPDCL